jgi:hypothetical protein
MEEINEDNIFSRRKELREDFLAKKDNSLTDESLLEILLSYAIPRKDLKALTLNLLDNFGSLNGVLKADFSYLVKIPGIKEYTATLLKVCEQITKNNELTEIPSIEDFHFQRSFSEYTPIPKDTHPKPNKESMVPKKGSGTGLVRKALLNEAVELLPKLPETDQFVKINEFIQNNLNFNSQSTRKRYMNYIVTYLFPDKTVDKTLQIFASFYPNSQELRDVCFYRFCGSYPLIYDIFEELLIPNIGTGTVDKSYIKEYLKKRFPETKDMKSGSAGFFEALTDSQIARAEKKKLYFRYRDISVPSFTFVLHSEFSKPGIYDIGKLEKNRTIRSLLWDPEKILPTLYELRNQGLIAKVSEIDSIRQFTTRYTLEQAIEKVVMK